MAEVAARAGGGGGPAVHFAHANGFNGATYAPILAPLADEARLLAADKKIATPCPRKPRTKNEEPRPGNYRRSAEISSLSLAMTSCICVGL